MNILHLIYDADVRWPLFENLVTGIQSRGFRQCICYLCGDISQQSTLDELGIELVSLDRTRRDCQRFRFAYIGKIQALLRSRQIHIVHCQRHKPTIYGTLAALLGQTHTRVVTTVHGRNRTRNLRRRLLNRMLFGRIAKIIAVSDSVRRDIIATNKIHDPQRVATVYNGIDSEKFRPPDDRQSVRANFGLDGGEFVFGTVGRLTKVKDQSLLLDAFTMLANKKLKLALLIAGAGPLGSQLRDQATRLRISDRVHFLGQRGDVPMVLQAMDVFVLPSQSEGHPLALLEAMSTGIPVIATDVGGIPEILTLDGFEHLVVPPGNREKLAAKMEELLSWSTDRRRETGDQLRRCVVTRFSVERMVKETAAIYEEVACIGADLGINIQ